MENFRVELKKSHFEVGNLSQVTFFSGINGSGKTEIIEALYQKLLFETQYNVDYVGNGGIGEVNNIHMKLYHVLLAFKERYKGVINSNPKKIERITSIINGLFAGSGRSISKFDSKITFQQDGEEVELNDLSTGQKRLMIILLTVILQNEKPSILLLDEPETSLHITTQRALVRTILELNPNVQLFIATNSPSIARMNWYENKSVNCGWYDKIAVWDGIVEDFN